MTGTAERFALRPSFDIAVERVGRDGEPIMRIEGALDAPQSLVDFAADEVEFAPAWTEHGGYPGVRAPAPLDYVGKLVRRLDPEIRAAFGLADVKLGRADCNLSMVTLTERDLTPLQRVPHIDTTYGLQFAILHYLCRPEHGGTAFYRHRATGFEAITPERIEDYERARDAELRGRGEPARFIDGDSEHYEQIGAVEAAFDRVAVYRSRLLHSGRIPPGRTPSADPRTGRLTANIFLTYRPA